MTNTVGNYIRQVLGADVLQEYRVYERRCIASLRLKNQIKFLQECVAEQVMPKMFGWLHRESFGGEPFPKYKTLFLEDQIQQAKFKKEEILMEIRHLKNQLRESVLCRRSDVSFDWIVSSAGEVAFYKSLAHKAQLDRKLAHLCNISTWNQSFNNDNIKILTDTNIDENCKIILSLGLNFSLGTENSDFVRGIGNINQYNFKHAEFNLEFIKGILFSSFSNKVNHLPQRFMQALNKLKKSHNLKISKADKGGCVVIMNKTDYLIKAYRLLNDQNTYAKLTKTPSIKYIQSEFNRRIKSVVNNGESENLPPLRTSFPKPKAVSKAKGLAIVNVSFRTLFSPKEVLNLPVISAISSKKHDGQYGINANSLLSCYPWS
ncbi:uncharacterized protein [Palaemon carinicauda]|uniref:uncharacterized protein n=1 Tax=Palaemon carinicauda TaxID=392227 RepID=UPI0035B5C208